MAGCQYQVNSSDCGSGVVGSVRHDAFGKAHWRVCSEHLKRKWWPFLPRNDSELTKVFVYD